MNYATIFQRTGLLTTALSFSSYALGLGMNRRLIVELDPISPATAAIESRSESNSQYKWGAWIDFNVAGLISTGPEYWTGDFSFHGPYDDASSLRREDLWYGERHKLSATRLQWHVTMWEIPETMRGWFVSGAYANLKVESKANRHTEIYSQSADSISATGEPDPADDTDLVSESRHNLELVFGQRWMFSEQRLTVTLGAVIAKTFRRQLSIESEDPQAKSDYKDMIEKFPFTPLSDRPFPRAMVNIGYAW